MGPGEQAEGEHAEQAGFQAATADAVGDLPSEAVRKPCENEGLHGSEGAEYPFSVPVITNLDTLEFSSRLCFFVGENGSGKSTLLEAIAENHGLGREGGSRSIRRETTAANASTAGLASALRLSWARKLLSGYFLRAESFLNIASYLDEDPNMLVPYGGISLHQQSHGESFMALTTNRLGPGGFYLMDEPEAALSPQRQLSFLVVLDNLIAASPDTQFIIATHSAVLLAFPGAQILSFDDGEIAPVRYEDTAPYQVLKACVNNRVGFMEQVLGRERD
jgi:predicted ATPase